MAEKLTTERRSDNMRRVKSRDTKPELIVRSLAHRMGYRFRLHRGDLPGKPDLAFPGRHAVIFVHGCFWHSHNCKRGRLKPVANAAFWKAKLTGNVERDAKNLSDLKAAGWRALTLWECEIRNEELTRARIKRFLN
jgi:DNA mismatch endonuclease (patch repair protein)